MTEPLLEINSLSRRDRDASKTLLNDVSLKVQTREQIGLSGESGSGKSMLLRAIAMLDPVGSCELRFRGQQVSDVPAYRRQVVYLHQRPAMIPGSVRDNLQLPFRIKLATQTFDEASAIHWLERLGKPASLLDQSIDTLSGGEQQLVAILRAVSLDPIILLLDEPTAALDADSTGRLEQLIQQWWSQSSLASYVWVSHDPNQLTRMATRRIEMIDGKCVESL